MAKLVRLTCASTTASTPATIRADLTYILDKARAFNINHEVYGVLFYGNNYFFQCMEGPKPIVDRLYQQLLTDKKHKLVKQLSYVAINKPAFKQWQMKYVLLNDDIKHFFNHAQHGSFNPYLLEGELHEKFLELLMQHNDVVAGQFEAVSPIAVTQSKTTLNVMHIIMMSVVSLVILLLGYWLVINYMPSY